jgi:F0F1-type ATP synthase assembly protein I
MPESGCMDQNNGNKIGEFARLTRLSAIGIAMILCTAIGYGMGFYIDKWLHTKPLFAIIFLIFGVIAGFLNAYRTIIKDTD